MGSKAVRYREAALSLVIMLWLSACGGGVSGKNGSDPFGEDSDTDSSANSYYLGYFNADNQFVEGQLGLSEDDNGLAQISAGGSASVVAVLVDSDYARVQDAVTITFSSNCVLAGLASLSDSLSTVNAQVSNTYTDAGCGGSAGTLDQITASATIDETTISASASIYIQSDAIGSITFSSLTASQIVLLNTSDNSSQSKTTATFIVTSESGVALAGQTVSFSLSSVSGGLSLNKTSAISDDDGEVSVQLTAGTVPTSVRIIATVNGANGELINSQSDLITVTTGLPTQRAFSLAADILNTESWGYDGEQVSITARLSDSFGNPVLDDTAVVFTAEGGQVTSPCLTSNGACSVTWTSSAPRPDNGRVTILAMAVGHESFIDSNGNNQFDDADGSAISSEKVSSGLYQVSSLSFSSGFLDMSEAWRDDNEDNQRSSDEPFFDYNNNGSFDEPDGLFNGPQCTASASCGLTTSVQVRQSLVLVMSGSQAYIDVANSDELIFASNHTELDAGLGQSITRGETASFSINLADLNANPLAEGSSIEISSDAGTLTLTGDQTVANTSQAGGTVTTFSLNNDLADADISTDALITLVVTSSKQITTRFSFTITLL